MAGRAPGFAPDRLDTRRGTGSGLASKRDVFDSRVELLVPLALRDAPSGSFTTELSSPRCTGSTEFSSRNVAKPTLDKGLLSASSPPPPGIVVMMGRVKER